MKKLLLSIASLALIAFASFQAYAWFNVGMVGGGVPAEADECAGYEICENFEAAGYDEVGWSESGSTINEDYTTTVLRGAQSLYLDNSGSGNPIVTSPTFASSLSTVWVAFRIQFPGNLPAANTIIFYLRNSTTNLLYVTYRTSFTGFRMSDGAVSCDTGSIAHSTTYYITIKYVSDPGGGNGVGEIYLDTDNTRPASPTASYTTSAQSFSADNLQILMSASTVDMIIDQILVDSDEITSVAN